MRYHSKNRNGLERPDTEGDIPVRVIWVLREEYLSRAGHEESCPKPRGPSRKAKYDRKTDSGPVP